MKPFVLAGSLALLGACGTSLEDHEALWAAKGPAAYHYSFAWSGFLPRLEAVVMVRSGVVSDTIVTSSAGFPENFRAGPWSSSSRTSVTVSTTALARRVFSTKRRWATPPASFRIAGSR
jgi:hypothetical protein